MLRTEERVRARSPNASCVRWRPICCRHRRRSVEARAAIARLRRRGTSVVRRTTIGRQTGQWNLAAVRAPFGQRSRAHCGGNTCLEVRDVRASKKIPVWFPLPEFSHSATAATAEPAVASKWASSASSRTAAARAAFALSSEISRRRCWIASLHE